jgi:hypothetical protein
VCQKQLSSVGSLAQVGARVSLALLFEVVLLVGGCLPQDDLSSYSSAWEGQLTALDTQDASMGAEASAAGAGGTGGAGGTPGMADASSGLAGDSNVDAGNSGAPDASDPAVAADSGSVAELDASGPPADAAP